jgi:hypothetical protein
MNYLVALIHNSRSLALPVILILILPLLASGQDSNGEESHEGFKHHRVSLMISHTHIPKGVPSVENGGAVIVPSWGLTYNYRIKKWAIGIHTDMEIATYIIEDANGNQIERSRPIIVSLMGGYNIWQGIELAAGFGREFEENHNFWVYRFGIEYNIEIGHQWDIAPALIFDVKENLYDSWTLGVVVGKKF